jgi:hypothetical protein
VWFLILAGAFTIAALLAVALGQLSGRDFPFLLWLALGKREPKPATKHPIVRSVRSQKVGA